MVKTIVSIGAAALLLGAGIANAQSYSYPATPVTYPTLGVSSSCINLTRDLSKGARGTDVSTLQSFLVAQNYPGSGSWMVTGYFGAATETAVRNFQTTHNLAVSGIVNAGTRAAMADCQPSQIGGTSVGFGVQPFAIFPQYNVPAASTVPACGSQSYPYTFGQFCPTPVLVPTLSFLTPPQGAIGSTVTIYGSGFSPTGNTVRFGNGILTNIGSNYSGNAITFTVPSALTGYGNQQVTLGTYQVAVSNGQGQTSNTLPFTVDSFGSFGAPGITSVTGPTTLQTGVSGTWSVTVRSIVNTHTTLSVRWGDENFYGAQTTAPQSQYISTAQTFTFTHAYSQAGTYTVTFSAIGQNGQEIRSTATVTVSGSGFGGVTISSVTPIAAAVGTPILLQGSRFTSYDNTVHFGVGGSRNIASFGNGTLIYFTIPSWVSPCDPNALTCSAQAIQVTPGSYPIRVSNASGSTQTFYVTVTN